MPEFATIVPSEDIAVAETPAIPVERGPWDDDDVVDAVLRLVADHHRAVGAAIGRRSFSPSLAELRQSPLGQDLRLLVAVSDGDVSHEVVRETAARVTDLLLRPLAAEGLVIPSWFWATAIGRIVAHAARETYGVGELLTLPEAAARLGTAPDLIAAWGADGAIAALPDERGVLLVPREAIEQRQAVARALTGWRLDGGEDVLVREQRLAS
jgi:hypothetical protein